MNMRNVIFGLAVLAAFSNVVISVLIMMALDRRGYKTSILWARALIFKYVSAYKEATRKETGKPGLLFYFWIGSVNLAAAGFLIYLIWHR